MIVCSTAIIVLMISFFIELCFFGPKSSDKFWIIEGSFKACDEFNFAQPELGTALFERSYLQFESNVVKSDKDY